MPIFNATNPVVVGGATKKDDYDRAFDDLLALYSGQMAIASQAALDFVYASSATQLARVAAVASKYPRLNAAGSAWEMAIPGAGVHDLWIPIAACRPKASGGCGALEDVLLSAGRYVAACPFDPTTAEAAYLTFRFPKKWNKSTATFQPVWLQTGGAAGSGVVWTLAGAAYADNETLDGALGTTVTSTDTSLAAKFYAEAPVSSAMTIANTPTNARRFVRFDIGRLPTDGGDTFGFDAYLLGFNLVITVDAETDA
jgi:hypothetical protein